MNQTNESGSLTPTDALLLGQSPCNICWDDLSPLGEWIVRLAPWVYRCHQPFLHRAKLVLRKDGWR